MPLGVPERCLSPGGALKVPAGCIRGALDVPGALRGASEVLWRCLRCAWGLRGALEVPGALRGALEVPQRCLKGASEVP